jgi:hypothetical protein
MGWRSHEVADRDVAITQFVEIDTIRGIEYILPLAALRQIDSRARGSPTKPG